MYTITDRNPLPTVLCQLSCSLGTNWAGLHPGPEDTAGNKMDMLPVLVGFMGCWARDNRPAHRWTQGMSSESEMNAEQGAGKRVLWGAGGCRLEGRGRF